MKALGHILWLAAIVVAILALNWARALTADSTGWEAVGVNVTMLSALFLGNISGSIMEYARQEDE